MNVTLLCLRSLRPVNPMRDCDCPVGPMMNPARQATDEEPCAVRLGVNRNTRCVTMKIICFTVEKTETPFSLHACECGHQLGLLWLRNIVLDCSTICQVVCGFLLRDCPQLSSAAVVGVRSRVDLQEVFPLQLAKAGMIGAWMHAVMHK